MKDPYPLDHPTRSDPGKVSACVLVVDDEDGMRSALRQALEGPGYRVLEARNGRQAFNALDSYPVDVAIVDMMLGAENGLALMEQLLARDNLLPVIILTAHASIRTAISAVRRGAYGYLTKPIDLEVLLREVERALERRGLVEEISMLNLAFRRDDHTPGLQLVGRSPVMQAVYRSIVRVAPTDATVTVYGESGTGKECVARAIHTLSPRGSHPFVAVSCGAIPDTLLESELFGHVRGAFTGATEARPGLFREAEGGTVFLDEIDNTSPPFQVALLRFLQERRIRPVGAESSKRSNVRVIVASACDLRKACEDGTFRKDLFFRVHVLPIFLAPLRERRGDIMLLAEHFLRRYALEEGREMVGFHQSAIRRLEAHTWPGNVRELENRVKRAVVLAPFQVIYPQDLFGEDLDSPGMDARRSSWRHRTGSSNLPSFREARAAFEREYLTRLLTLTRGNISEAARMAGRYRADLYAMLHKHGLSPDDFR